MESLFLDFVDLAKCYVTIRIPSIRDGYSIDNLSQIDKQRILFYIVENYPNVAEDSQLREFVVAAAAIPKKKEYRLYENLISWIQECIYESNITFADIENISENDCDAWLEYVFEHYDFSGDDTLLNGIALLMHTPVDFTSEEYRCSHA